MAESFPEASWRRRLLLLPPVVAGAAILAWVVAGAEPPARKPATETARHVRVIEVRPTTLVPRIRGFGTVKPANVYNAVAQVSGRIVYLHPDFKRGAILAQGTEIVRIEAADYELAIAEAEANIRAAEASLYELKVTGENLEQLLRIERESLALNEAQLERKRELQKRGAMAQASVDDELRNTLAQRKLVQELENSIRLLPIQRAVQQEQIAVNRARLESARLNLSRTRIALPFAARIAEVDVEETQFVQVGTRLGAADDIRTAEIEAQFPIAQLAGMGRAIDADVDTRSFARQDLEALAKAVGLHAIVRLGATGEAVEWRGRVVRASDTIDPQTRTVGIIAAVEGSYEQAVPGHRPPLTKGMFVEVELRLKSIEGKLLVPRSALHDGQLYLADTADRLQLRAVKVGLAQGDIIGIESGLAAGERVVVTDLSPALPGMLLRVTADEALAEALAAEAAAEPRQ